MTSHEPVSPEPIVQIASGFMATKYLFVANEIGVFSALAQGPATLAHIAERTNIPERTARIVLDATVALGLLVREGDRYRNSEAAQTYLTGRGPADLRAFLRFWNRLSYSKWQFLEHAVRGTRDAIYPKELTAEEQALFSEGVAAITEGTARALARKYDLSIHQRVLDLGGGTGSFLIALLRDYSHLHTTLFERPQVIEVAKRQLADIPHAHSIALTPGDFSRTRFPKTTTRCSSRMSFTCCHRSIPARCSRVFERARILEPACSSWISGPMRRIRSHCSPP